VADPSSRPILIHASLRADDATAADIEKWYCVGPPSVLCETTPEPGVRAGTLRLRAGQLAIASLRSMEGTVRHSRRASYSSCSILVTSVSSALRMSVAPKSAASRQSKKALALTDFGPGCGRLLNSLLVSVAGLVPNSSTSVLRARCVTTIERGPLNLDLGISLMPMPADDLRDLFARLRLHSFRKRNGD
jgi:hypothetical protein